MAEPAAATPNSDERPEGDPEIVPVVVALGRVAREVTVLRKTRTSEGGKGQASFNFRGIDDVMNALGPVFRRHGVLCVPSVAEKSHEYVDTKSGARMCYTRLTAGFTFYGPGGDSLPAGSAPGEAFDSGDKSTAKAMSVALRTFLLQSFCLPTDDADPDETREQLQSVVERQQLPPSRAADRTRQPAEEDPWKVHPIRPSGRAALNAAVRADEFTVLASLWHEINADGREHGPQSVTDKDLTREELAVLGIRGPLEIREVMRKIKAHLEQEGCSVREHIRLNKLPLDQTGQSVPDGDATA
jgi:hypothetical protein